MKSIQWEKGKAFSLGGKKFYVVDTDIEHHYQTNFTRTYLKFFTQKGGKYMPVWVDSLEVEPCH